MSHPRLADLAALIDALLSGEVEFIVVGGASAILHGALAMTQDLDIVPSLAPANVERLAAVLDQLLPHSEALSGGNRRVRVVDLPTLIEIKTTRPFYGSAAIVGCGARLLR